MNAQTEQGQDLIVSDNERRAFWGRVTRDGEGCWEWRGLCHPNGYGRVCNGRLRGDYAHRAAWMLANERTIPDGMCVCHTCDNPPCCNPSHLWLGTQTENIADRQAKGRTCTWTKVRPPTAKFSDEEALAIRAEYAAGGISMARLGAKHGTTACVVYRIVSGKGYRFVGAANQ